jgi:hypothetical protein
MAGTSFYRQTLRRRLVNISCVTNLGTGKDVVQCPLNDQSVGFRGTNLGVLDPVGTTLKALCKLGRRFASDQGAWNAIL